MVLRSVPYDDVYFSVQGGLAEKRHVFLSGNQLPARWQGRDDFVIAEAGFGTGLNFLVTLQSFLATTKKTQRLHYLSFEKHPLGAADIRAALSLWRDDIGPEIDALCAQYHMIVPGAHRLIFAGRVHLTLLIGDINDLLPQIDAPVDAWYLDGFNPAKNPAMWSDTVFAAMKDLSATGATAATYSAARVVKDGLARAEFVPAKQPGFGYKSDMLTAQRDGPGRKSLVTKRCQRVTIHGAGLAGATLARTLVDDGHAVTVVAPHGIADAASGNPRGLYNPRLTKTLTPLAFGHASGFAALYRFMKSGDIDAAHAETGALHLIRGDDLRDRFTGMAENWGWGDSAQIIDAATASDIAGIPIHHETLWLPRSGSVSPHALCHHYLSDLNVVSAAGKASPSDIQVLACGAAVTMWEVAAHLPLQTVRGQVSFMAQSPQSQNLKTNLCYGGYLSAAHDGGHVLGSTFQHWLTDTAVRDDDHRYVLDRLGDHVGPILTMADVCGGRAALRVTTPDRAPVIGRVVDTPFYVSTAHGSHGLISTTLAARLIADMIADLPQVFPRDLRDAVDPSRFSKQTKR